MPQQRNGKLLVRREGPGQREPCHKPSASKNNQIPLEEKRTKTQELYLDIKYICIIFHSLKFKVAYNAYKVYISYDIS